MQIIQNRRGFLKGAAAAGAVGLVPQFSSAAEPPPETTTIRIGAPAAGCNGPLVMATELLYEEGFTSVDYNVVPMNPSAPLAEGKTQLDFISWADFLPTVDTGGGIIVLSGIHSGCMELRVKDEIQTIPDLRGKRVGVSELGTTQHMVVSIMAAYVGLDPATDITWVVDSSVSQAELFTAGKVDAFIGFPADPGQPCSAKVGHVLVDTAHDKPWSNYFCCMLGANADFMHSNPVATKRALRAILKGTDICHREPEMVARRMATHGFLHQCVHDVLHHTRYDMWRDHDPEDTLRFFALRLNELGMIKTAPNEAISGHTDWRFLNEVRRELKA
jgi:NitT/TauT family transport system substrate-binding protein